MFFCFFGNLILGNKIGIGNKYNTDQMQCSWCLDDENKQ
jgi:hypothetical protein